MSEVTIDKVVKWATNKAEKESISLACAAAQKTIAVLGGSQAQGDKLTLALAAKVMMKSGGRAERYLDHFLKGSGDDLQFEIAELIASEKDVRERLVYEITRKILGIKVGSEKGHSKESPKKLGARNQNHTEKMSVDNLSGGLSVDPIVTIFQKNYLDQDWWFALGTFGIEWKIIAYLDKDRVLVKLFGKNEYRWYPQAERITQCVHESASRLEKTDSGHKSITNKPAKPFLIIGKPASLIISLKNREILEVTTFHNFNPDNHKSLIKQISTGLSYK